MNRVTDNLKIKTNIIMSGSKEELMNLVMCGDNPVLNIELDGIGENLSMQNKLVSRNSHE